MLNAIPTSAQSSARKALQDIYNAEDREHAVKAVTAFEKTYGANLLRLPGRARGHLRTTNPIESTFAAVRLRTKVTKGAGSTAAALAMVFKLVESAQARWRAVNAPHLVALVLAGARFERGLPVERPEVTAA